jgi:hypothetical protein
MFNLDLAISEWRRQMAAGGIKTPAVLDELESHLRDDVEQQMRAGSNTERAFETAVKKIGPARALKKEFGKSTAAAVLEKLMIAAAVLVVAFGLLLSTATVILCYGRVGDRLVASVAMSVIFITACGWPAIVSRLPVIHPRRKRQIIEVVCLLAGFGISTFYVQLILPFFERRGEGMMLPAVGFFAIFPIAVGFALAAALERATAQEADANYRVSN